MADFSKKLAHLTKLEGALLFKDCKEVVSQLATDNGLKDGQVLCFLVSFCASEIMQSVQGLENKRSMRKTLAEQMAAQPIPPED